MNIRHSPGLKLFLADFEERLAFLQYEKQEQRFVICHTFVPPEGRGRGIAEALVRTAVEEAGRQGCDAICKCPFAAAIVQKRGWSAGPLDAVDGHSEVRPPDGAQAKQALGLARRP